jgi:hypothetical protein
MQHMRLASPAGMFLLPVTVVSGQGPVAPGLWVDCCRFPKAVQKMQRALTEFQIRGIKTSERRAAVCSRWQPDWGIACWSSDRDLRS